jgi:flagellar motor protein MotB
MSWYATVSKFALAAGVVLLSAGCSGRKDVAIAAKDAELRKQEELIAQERADKEKYAEMNKALADQNTKLAEDNGALAAKTLASQQAMQSKMSDLEAALKDLKLQKVASNDGVTDGGGYVKRADGSISIIVANTVLFESGKADLKTSAHPMLSNVCKTLKSKFPNNFIRVEGHTDATPVVHNKAKFPDNMALSIARSRAVYDYMIKDGGIAASKMYTAGYGEFQPLVHPEKTAADRSKNRRVEIVIMPENVKVTKERLADNVKK